MTSEQYICENCKRHHDGSYGSGRFCSDHCRRVWCGKHVKLYGNFKCNFNRNKPNNGRCPYGTWKCLECDLIFETRQQLFHHRKSYHPIQTGSVWNKGLTKDTDKRIARQVRTLKRKISSGEIIPYMKGKHVSQKTKKKVSLSMKRYLKKHPDKVPYLLNHSSKESYPERYFRECFLKEGFPKFEQDKYVQGYFLDFAFEDYNVYVEIDGEQHYHDKRIIEHDIRRLQELNRTSWRCILRIRWARFKKLQQSQKHKFILGLKKKILESLCFS